MACRMCEERGQTWSGSSPKCPFGEEPGEWEDNWNCATIGAIRDICYEGQDLPRGVEYQYCEDEKYATINIDAVIRKDGTYIGLTLWLAWYKNRGATDQIWILDSDSIPHRPNEEECLAIIEAYKEVSCPVK